MLERWYFVIFQTHTNPNNLLKKLLTQSLTNDAAILTQVFWYEADSSSVKSVSIIIPCKASDPKLISQQKEIDIRTSEKNMRHEVKPS